MLEPGNVGLENGKIRIKRSSEVAGNKFDHLGGSKEVADGSMQRVDFAVRNLQQALASRAKPPLKWFCEGGFLVEVPRLERFLARIVLVFIITANCGMCRGLPPAVVKRSELSGESRPSSHSKKGPPTRYMLKKLFQVVWDGIQPLP